MKTFVRQKKKHSKIWLAQQNCFLAQIPKKLFHSFNKTLVSHTKLFSQYKWPMTKIVEVTSSNKVKKNLSTRNVKNP